MGIGYIGIIFPIIMFICMMVFFVFAIILMVKASKALSIWIRKNDDMNVQPPPVQPNPNENSI